MTQIGESRNIIEYLGLLLAENTEYVINGKLNRTILKNDIRTYNASLIEKLLADETFRSRFTVEVAGTTILKTEALVRSLDLKDYMADNFTSYANEIGLYTEGKNLMNTSSVILNWPYKDAFLTAGMTKEEVKPIGRDGLAELDLNKREANKLARNINELNKRSEIEDTLLNEVVAADDIIALKEPKAYRNVKKYSADNIEGESVDAITKSDNLIIKGNNLIALHSIKKRYYKSIKGIFIDPPYFFHNKKNDDSFRYNSNFKLSTWLTFMKNRLEVSKDLLSDEGVIAVVVGVDGYAHLKILMDEIFDVSTDYRRYIGTITWRKTDNQSNIGDYANVIDYILMYRKNSSTKLNLLPLTERAKREYSYTDKNGESYRRSNILDLTRGRYTYEITTPNKDKLYGPWMIEEDEYIKLIENDGIHWPTRGQQIPYGKIYLKDSIEKGQITSDFWDGSYGTNQRSADEIKELFGSRVFEYAKPEKLVQNIISLISNKGDIVLDFFMGTATTQAVAMKMNRRFIGVEQMDYIETISIERLKKVIEGELGGISESVNWDAEKAREQGASFIYAELMEKNQEFVSKIENSKSKIEVWAVFNNMRDIADFRFQVKLDQLTPKKVPDDITLVQLQTLMINALKSSALYVNAGETQDPEIELSTSDRTFNESFYKEI